MPALEERSYRNPDKSLDIKKFKLLNPFTPEDLAEAETLKFDESRDPKSTTSTKSKYKTDRALLVFVKHPSGDNAQPTLTIPVTGFTHLWTRFKQRHEHLPIKEFHEQLYALLARETEGKTRTTGGKVNFSNFWCTPLALLRIFLEFFHLSVERFCNPLNFSPLFPSATKGSIEDAF